MVKLTELPCEIITMILEHGSVRTIHAAILSCRHIRNCFDQHPSLAGRIILRQIPQQLLPYALGAVAADRMPIPRTEEMVQNIINTMCPAFIPTAISLVLRTRLGLLLKLEDLHNIIHTMALDYANEAWDFMQTTNMRVPRPGTLELSQNEYLRFCRAFYRVEIRHSMERPKPSGPRRPRAWNEGEDFLDPLPSCDREQMACVLEYQERLFLNSVHEVLAHDVAMGNIGINYVMAHEDHLKRGLRFLVKITGDLSYDEKKHLLYTKYGPGNWINLWKVLDTERDWLDMDRQLVDDPWARNKDGDLVHVFRDRVDPMDLDPGPGEAFRRSITRATMGLTTIDFIATDGIRDRAYVLWDMDRLLQLEAGWAAPGPFRVFVDAPKPTQLPPYRERLAEEKALKESFKARKEIWDKGGSGYWRADDLSKVEWAGERWVPHAYPEYPQY